MQATAHFPAMSVDQIDDTFHAVIGDAFHMLNRIRVPVRQCCKKAFFVALSEAFFVWEPTMLKKVSERLRRAGWTEEAIEAKRYFNRRFFAKRALTSCWLNDIFSASFFVM